MSKITIEIPESLQRQVESLSADEGVSIDQFFATAATEKLYVMRELDRVRNRASQASDEDFETVLESIPAASVSDDWDQIS